MTLFSRKTIILSALLPVLFVPAFFVSAEDLAAQCLTLTEKGCQNSSSAECRLMLEKCEKYYNDESAKIEKDLDKTAQEKKTLQNKISEMNKKIKDLTYKISQSNLVIKDLTIQIGDTEESISSTSLKIEDSKSKLSNIIRSIYEEDNKLTLEILLGEKDLSGFFDNLTSLEILNSKSRDLLANIKILKTNLEDQKESLDGEKGDLEQTVKMQKLQKEASAKTKQEQEYYYKITEQEYQSKLLEKQETQKKAAAIRARIFELIGVAKAPTFGEALEIAEYVEKLTGIRPAFLMAILTQESNIGKNVGQCYLPRDASENMRKRIMAAPPASKRNDVAVFLAITQELGRDPYSTPVSCPMSFGWGGAMGPAQFIPTTWNLFDKKIETITGSAANPWSIKDAFLAAGLYLTDFGAANRTRTAEKKAALAYFSGSTTNTRYSFYANSVLNIADQYEEDIKAIKGN